MSLGAPGPRGCALSSARRDQSLLFEPVERGGHRARRDGAVEPPLGILEDGPPVPVPAKPDDRHEHGLFEDAQYINSRFRTRDSG